MEIEAGYYVLRCVVMDEKGELETKYRSYNFLRHRQDLLETSKNWKDELETQGYVIYKDVSHQWSLNQREPFSIDI